MQFYNKLKYNWIVWFDKPESKIDDNNWDQFLIKIDSFHQIEKFWSLFNNILLPSSIKIGTSLHFFKSGIEPKWEDVSNLKGGKWVLALSKQYISSINILWEKTLILLISGKFDEIKTESVNGVVLNIRKDIIKISIWTKDCFDIHIQLSIGKLWKKTIKDKLFSKKLTLEYFPHSTYLHT
jgi:translation initiation factor 4E